MKQISLITVVLVAFGGAQASANPGTATKDKESPNAETKPAPAKAAGAKKARDAPGGEEGSALKQTSLFGGASAAPWRGSSIVYRNTVSAVSLDRSADLTYNPYYAMTWSFRAWWWFSKKFYIRGWLDVDRELTQSDVTSYAGEAWLGDLKLSPGLSNIVTIPKAKIGVSFSLIFTLPTSKASQARTLALGIGAQTRLSRSFKVLKGLHLGYSVRATPTFYRYTTSERETPLVPGCSAAAGGCDSFLNTGLRNRMVRLTHYGDVSLLILPWLGVSLAMGQAIDWLYPLGDSPEEVSLLLEEPQNQRFVTFFDLSVAFRPLKMLEIVIGYSALHPQLAPNSKYYVPFFNRYSALYLDLKLKIDGLVARIKRSVK